MLGVPAVECGKCVWMWWEWRLFGMLLEASINTSHWEVFSWLSRPSTFSLPSSLCPLLSNPFKSIYLSVWLSVCLSTYHPSIHLPTYPSILNTFLLKTGITTSYQMTLIKVRADMGTRVPSQGLWQQDCCHLHGILGDCWRIEGLTQNVSSAPVCPLTPALSRTVKSSWAMDNWFLSNTGLTPHVTSWHGSSRGCISMVTGYCCH